MSTEAAHLIRSLSIRDGQRIAGRSANAKAPYAGKIQGVRYDELTPILLNVVQQQKQLLWQEEKLLTEQGKQLHDLQRQFDQFRQEYAAQVAAAHGEELALVK